jgi:hypothetical protein
MLPKTDSVIRRCQPNVRFARKRTSIRVLAMSHKCHKRWEQSQQSTALFDHLVGDREQRRRHGEAEGSCGLQIEDELEP